MLVTSDNGAKNLLLQVMDKKYLDQLFSIVALADPNSSQIYKISSKKYALFLRVPHGSSYLEEGHSELLLSMLAKSDFREGLVAGLPEGIPVAHKYGVYEFSEQVDGKTVLARQLHDCGVVYYAKRPYLFCFMTKGKDVQTLYKIISHVSKLVYDHQEKNDD